MAKGFVHEVSVRLSHVDGARIVYFARIVDYFHEAYEGFLDAGGCSLAKVLEDSEWVAPIVHVEVDFKSPLRLGETACIEVSAHEKGEHSMVLYYRAWDKNTPERTIATGHTKHVFVDASSFKKTKVPPAIERVLESVPKHP